MFTLPASTSPPHHFRFNFARPCKELSTFWNTFPHTISLFPQCPNIQHSKQLKSILQNLWFELFFLCTFCGGLAQESFSIFNNVISLWKSFRFLSPFITDISIECRSGTFESESGEVSIAKKLNGGVRKILLYRILGNG